MADSREEIEAFITEMQGLQGEEDVQPPEETPSAKASPPSPFGALGKLMGSLPPFSLPSQVGEVTTQEVIERGGATAGEAVGTGLAAALTLLPVPGSRAAALALKAARLILPALGAGGGSIAEDVALGKEVDEQKALLESVMTVAPDVLIKTGGAVRNQVQRSLPIAFDKAQKMIFNLSDKVFEAPDRQAVREAFERVDTNPTNINVLPEPFFNQRMREFVKDAGVMQKVKDRLSVIELRAGMGKGELSNLFEDFVGSKFTKMRGFGKLNKASLELDNAIKGLGGEAFEDTTTLAPNAGSIKESLISLKRAIDNSILKALDSDIPGVPRDLLRNAKRMKAQQVAGDSLGTMIGGEPIVKGTSTQGVRDEFSLEFDIDKLFTSLKDDANRLRRGIAPSNSLARQVNENLRRLPGSEERLMTFLNTMRRQPSKGLIRVNNLGALGLAGVMTGILSLPQAMAGALFGRAMLNTTGLRVITQALKEGGGTIDGRTLAFAANVARRAAVQPQSEPNTAIDEEGLKDFNLAPLVP